MSSLEENLKKAEPKPTILQKREIELMSQKEADEFVAKDFYRLIVTMYPEDFLFLLEKISIETLKKIFGNLSETEISLMDDKVENNPLWKDRLVILTNKIKPKDKYITQEITLEYEQVFDKMKKLVEKIKKDYGYSITSLVLEQNRLYDENKKISRVEEIQKTISDLEEFEKIIKEIRELIKSGTTFQSGVDIENFSFNKGGYGIVLVNSLKSTWNNKEKIRENSYEVFRVIQRFAEHLKDKYPARFK